MRTTRTQSPSHSLFSQLVRFRCSHIAGLFPPALLYLLSVQFDLEAPQSLTLLSSKNKYRMIVDYLPSHSKLLSLPLA